MTDIAVVTGAANGLGAGIAGSLARRGWVVALADVDEPGIDRVAADLTGAGGRAIAVRTDVTDAASVERLAAVVAERLGPTTLLVNNAGIESVGPLWSDPAATRRLLEVNLLGVVHGIAAFVPAMIAAGRPATVLTIASVGGFSRGPNQGAYQTSKRALIALSECLTSDLAAIDAPVTVVTAVPGGLATGIFETADNSGEAGAVALHTTMNEILARSGMPPAEAAELIVERALAGERWISTHPDLAVSYVEDQVGRLGVIAASIGAAGPAA